MIRRPTCHLATTLGWGTRDRGAVSQGGGRQPGDGAVGLQRLARGSGDRSGGGRHPRAFVTLCAHARDLDLEEPAADCTVFVHVKQAEAERAPWIAAQAGLRVIGDLVMAPY